jgi:hypothetical protein
VSHRGSYLAYVGKLGGDYSYQPGLALDMVASPQSVVRVVALSSGRRFPVFIEHICDASQGSCSEMQGRLSLQKQRFVDSSLAERRLTWSWHITTHPGIADGRE